MRVSRQLGLILVLVFGGWTILVHGSVKCQRYADVCIAFNTGDKIIAGQSRIEALKNAVKNYIRMYTISGAAHDDRVGVCLYNTVAWEHFPLSDNVTEILRGIDDIKAVSVEGPSGLHLAMKCCYKMLEKGRDYRPDLTVIAGLPDVVADVSYAAITAQEIRKTGHISVLDVNEQQQSTFSAMASNPLSVTTFSDFSSLRSDSTSFGFSQAFNTWCPEFDNPCSGSEMENGIGYMPGPDCWEYYQCVLKYGVKVPKLRKTAFGTFWDSERRTQADPTLDFRCPNDRCWSLPAGALYGRPDNCRMYMQCRVREPNTGLFSCCPEGNRFVEGFGCVSDPSCTDICTPKQIDPSNGCTTVADPTDPKQYFHYGFRRRCAGGTKFSLAQCGCVIDVAEYLRLVSASECAPEVELVVTDESVLDGSRNQYRITDSGIAIQTLVDGTRVAFLQNTYMQIQGFSNNDLQDKFAMYLKVRPNNFNFNATVVSNSGCAVGRETYAIVVDTVGGVTVVRAEATVFPDGQISTGIIPLSLNPNEFNHVVMEYDGMRLALMVRHSGGQFVQTVDGLAIIAHQQTPCAMQIGRSSSSTQFTGAIEKFKVFKCLRDKLEYYME